MTQTAKQEQHWDTQADGPSIVYFVIKGRRAERPDVWLAVEVKT